MMAFIDIACGPGCADARCLVIERDRLRDGDLVWAVYTCGRDNDLRFLQYAISGLSHIESIRNSNCTGSLARWEIWGGRGDGNDPYLREGAFLPEATAAMGDAFEAVRNELHLADESKELRALVATRIIAAARQGEIDPVHLRTKALVGFFSAITPRMDPNRNTALRQRARTIKRHDGELKPEPKSPTAGDVKSRSAA